MAPSPDWRQLYPFASHYLDRDGLRYHYLDEGAGEPLLLVHGNPTWSFYWRRLVSALRGEYRLIVPDHVGCGLSDKPQNYPYLLDTHVANLQALVEHLDLRQVTLIAHDWGGAIGMGCAVRAPSRFARFVLLNTAAFRSQRIPLRIRICRTPVLGQLAVQGFNAFARAALHMATTRSHAWTPAERAGYLAPYDSWAHRIATHRFVLDIPLAPGHPSYDTLTAIEEGLPQFRDRPMQFIWGMRDWCFTPHFLERFEAIFPQAESRRIKDAGHYVVEDAAAEVESTIREFLKRHPLSETAGQ